MGFNLLPQELRPKKTRVYIIMSIFILFIMLVSSIAYLYNLKLSVDQEKTENLVLEKELNRRRNDYNELENKLENDSFYKIYENYKSNNIELLTTRKWIDYSKFISTIGEIMTEISVENKVLLEKIESVDGEVFLSGQAENYNGLNNFFEKLKELNVITDVKVEKLEFEPEPEIIIYEIKCEIKYKW